jgi:hypothetical protein
MLVWETKELAMAEAEVIAGAIAAITRFGRHLRILISLLLMP